MGLQRVRVEVGNQSGATSEGVLPPFIDRILVARPREIAKSAVPWNRPLRVIMQDEHMRTERG